MHHFDSAVALDITTAIEMPSPEGPAIGRYDEARTFYTEPMFEGRTIHSTARLEYAVLPGTPVFAPFDGMVYAVANNTKRLDYGAAR